MDLHQKIIEYIESSTDFDEALALEVIQFQMENIPLYAEFLRALGRPKIQKIDDLPFFPVDFFKKYGIIVGDSEGYFESSGTTGNRSRVLYHRRSLELYRASALRSFPFEVKEIYSLVPSFNVAEHSSLSYMLRIFEEKCRVIYLQESYEIDDMKGIADKILGIKAGSLIFLTSTQLLRLSEYMAECHIKSEERILIVETGGYKALNRPYIRTELYAAARAGFPEAEFFSEYGMTELFSQFYSTCGGLYRYTPYAKVFTEGEGFLRVFDFANLYTISGLLVPDRIKMNGKCFDVLGRSVDEERGCAFTFG